MISNCCIVRFHLTWRWLSSLSDKKLVKRLIEARRHSGITAVEGQDENRWRSPPAVFEFRRRGRLRSTIAFELRSRIPIHERCNLRERNGMRQLQSAFHPGWFNGRDIRAKSNRPPSSLN